MNYLKLFENWLPNQTKKMLIKKLAQYIDASFDVSGLSHWVADPDKIYYKDVYNYGQDFFEITINDNSKFFVKSGSSGVKEKEFELEDFEGIVDFIEKTNRTTHGDGLKRLKRSKDILFNKPDSRLNRWKKFHPDVAKKKYGYKHW